MRNEIKFSGGYAQLRKIISEQAASRAYSTRSINSIYFDTRDLDDFNDSEEGSVPRQKTRLRWYGTSAIRKLLSGAVENKSTLANHREKDSFRVTDIEQAPLIDLISSVRKTDVIPVALVSYVREYFATASGLRFTLDRHIKYAATDRFFNVTRTERDYANILELKAPVDVDYSSATKNFADLRTRFSKYCEAVRRLEY
ncbi:MAG: VTC domain-containing protein [Alphaproteobacteria bacterium]|nr:VTC domain-containing protein [Alphaproteobacteria bacterium]